MVRISINQKQFITTTQGFFMYREVTNRYLYISKLLVLILILLFSGSVFGQSTVTIGSGTTTTSNFPLTSNYGYSYTQQIFTQAQINTSGQIQKLRFYWSSGAMTNSSAWVIYMGHTSKTTFSSTTDWIPLTSLTQVFNGTITPPSVAGWWEITLSTPFSYNNTDNLVIAVDENTSGYGSLAYWRSFTSGSNTGIYYRSDGTNPDPNSPPTSNGRSSAINQVQLDFASNSPMTFVSSTTEQGSTLATMPGNTNQDIIRLKVVTDGALSPFNINSITFNTTGTTSPSDLASARVYYTTNTTFSTSVPFGDAVANPNGDITVTGNQVLANGNNYFWLAYDVAGGATEYNVVDGQCTGFVTTEAGDGARVPTVTSPDGSRTIRAALNGIYTINPDGSGLRNYTTFTAAVNELNLLGISSAVTFNIPGDKTFAESPLNITATGTVTNTITFQRDGGTNKPIINFTGTVATTDAGFKLNGGDYFTFNGLDIRDAGTGSSDYLEYGFHLFAPTATNGCQYNMVKNCNIDMTKANLNTRGIYTSVSSPSEAAGTNSNNKYYNNILTDSYYGYSFTGYSSMLDNANEIGSDGGLSQISDMANTGIFFNYQTGLKIFSTTIRDFTGSGQYYGIYTGLGSNTTEIYNNTITNISSTSTSSTLYGIYITSGASSGTAHRIYGNTISSITSSYGIFGVYVTGGATDFYSNVVNGLSSSGSSGTYGVYLSPSGINNIFKNKIYNIAFTGTSSSIVYGLTIAGGTTVNAYNNYVYDIKAPGSTGTPGVRALNITSGTTVNVFYNTVFLNYTSTSASNQSAALYITAGPGTVDLRNNIFVNKVDVSTGTRAVAFYRTTTTLTIISANSNNNIYYAGAPGAKNLLFYDGTNSDQTLAAYKTRMATRDQNAMTEDVPFVSTTEEIDPHINTETATQVESGGIRITSPLAITEDYDGTIRAMEDGYMGAGTAPDVGAHEGDFKGLDLNPPSISYTPLLNTSTTVNRTLTASITDATGVPTSGDGLPMIYWKIGRLGTYSGVQSTNTDGSNYSFVFGGGSVLGDTVFYYVVAQDLASTPNLACNPSVGAAGLTANPPTAGTPPTTPNSYIIVGSITGEILVGEGQTYTSLTANTSEGLFKAINDKVVTGNLTVKITSNLTETGAVALNHTAEEAIYSITIQPNDASLKTISGSYAGGLIRLNGADGVTFDGRFGGSGNYLTFSNTSTAASGVFQLISLGTNAGATNNTIRNCNISTGSKDAAQYGISVGGGTLGSTGADNDNISLVNNVITVAANGIFVSGTTATSEGGLDNVTISGNKVTTDSNTVASIGIKLAYALNSNINANEIDVRQSSSNAPVGISIETGVSNTTVSHNLIKRSKYTGTGGYGGRGITVGTGSATSNITISNNVIYGVTGDNYNAFGGSSSMGIAVGIIGNSSTLTTTTGGVNIYYNSVNMYDGYNRAATSCITTALYIGSGASALNIRNNIFANSMDNSGNATSKSYSIYSAATNAAFTSINYNDYYAPAPEGVIGFLSSDKTTLADWQTASGQDANSQNIDPQFTNVTNLQPATGAPVLGAGTPIAGITTDFLNVTRSETTPSIGAYESGLARPAVDWANLQHPSSVTIAEGTQTTIYARVFEPGITGGSGTHTGITCWIGYSTENTNPNTWTNWVSATFNMAVDNNDEFTANLGAGLAPGTYYYASRFLITDGSHQYGGYNVGGGGFWDGATNVSGVLTVQNASITWANLQHPATATIQEGQNITVYGRVYADGVTTNTGSQPGIQCWIGYSTENTDPSTWTNWVPATFNQDVGNNDEYKADLGAALAVGTYYYATRFQLVADPMVYGGYSEGGGNFWDGTNYVSGNLSVNEIEISVLSYFNNFSNTGGWTVSNGNNLWFAGNGVNAYGQSNDPMRFADNFSVESTNYLITPLINLSNYSNPKLKFHVAYRQYSTEDDRLEVVYTTNNGTSWNTGSPVLYNKAGSTLATLSASTTEFIPSNANNWRLETVDLSQLAGLSNVKLGFKATSDYGNNCYIDNVYIYEQGTTASNPIPAASLDPITFTGTGTTIQFTANSSGELQLTVDKINSSPGGTPLPGLPNIAPQYWSITVTSGTVNGTYCITLDLAGVPGINNYSTLHLLKRDNANSAWVDIGVPTDISGSVLKWCYPSLTSFSEFGIGGDVGNPLPVELASFVAAGNGRNVSLNWTTKTEINSNRFVVERSLSRHSLSFDGHSLWEPVGEVKASGNSNSPKEYQYTDKNLNSGKYSYRLKMIDNDGSFEYSDVIEAEVELPREYSMTQNYPNPFNPTTIISYQLPVDTRVKLELYSITGEKVATLIDDIQEAGYHNYQLTTNNYQLSSGVYIYRMVAGDFVSVKKMVVLK